MKLSMRIGSLLLLFCSSWSLAIEYPNSIERIGVTKCRQYAACAAFDSDDRSTKQYNLMAGNSSRATLWGIKGTKPWDTHALVKLDSTGASDSCKRPSYPPFNLKAALLFIQTDSTGQYLYLINDGKVLRRKLDTGPLQSDGDFAWLKTSASENNDGDPYDYYVYFSLDTISPNSAKQYQVEAFPKALEPSTDADIICQNERPEKSIRPAHFISGDRTMPQAASGAGNEPVH